MPYQRDAVTPAQPDRGDLRDGLHLGPFRRAARGDHDGRLGEVMAGLGAPGVLTCRLTHVYPDGPAPYYGVYASGRWGSLVSMWDQIKTGVSEAIAAHGGTITHHHAVGRDHAPWYDRQRPEPFAAALRAAKTTLDPRGILNPGVLGL